MKPSEYFLMRIAICNQQYCDVLVVEQASMYHFELKHQNFRKLFVSNGNVTWLGECWTAQGSQVMGEERLCIISWV